MCQHHREEDAEEGWGENTSLLNSTLYLEGGRKVTLNLDDPLHVIMEGLDDAVLCWWAAGFLQDLEESITTDKVESLCQVDECHVQGLSLLSAFLLQLSD